MPTGVIYTILTLTKTVSRTCLKPNLYPEEIISSCPESRLPRVLVATFTYCWFKKINGLTGSNHRGVEFLDKKQLKKAGARLRTAAFISCKIANRNNHIDWNFRFPGASSGPKTRPAAVTEQTGRLTWIFFVMFDESKQTNYQAMKTGMCNKSRVGKTVLELCCVGNKKAVEKVRHPQETG